MTAPVLFQGCVYIIYLLFVTSCVCFGVIHGLSSFFCSSRLPSCHQLLKTCFAVADVFES